MIDDGPTVPTLFPRASVSLLISHAVYNRVRVTLKLPADDFECSPSFVPEHPISAGAHYTLCFIRKVVSTQHRRPTDYAIPLTHTPALVLSRNANRFNWTCCPIS